MVAVVIIAEAVSLVELSGLIVATAANLSTAPGSPPEASRVLVLSNQVAKGLHQVQRFLRGHSIRVEALQARVFRDANGDSVIVTHSPDDDHETVHHNNGYAVENELEVFGDPVLAIVNNAAKETNGA